MRYPTIHMNGTGYETLNREYMNAHKALGDALVALEAVTVHGRDYYVQDGIGGDAISQAYAEHQARVLALVRVKLDLMKILINIDEQGRR